MLFHLDCKGSNDYYRPKNMVHENGPSATNIRCSDENCEMNNFFFISVVVDPAENCSFPFTYNGQLCHECISNVTNVTDVCDGQKACLLAGRQWAICSPHAGVFFYIYLFYADSFSLSHHISRENPLEGSK